MSIVRGNDGSVYTINTSTAFSGEATTEDGSTQIYQIDDSGKRNWNPNTAITPSTGSLDKTWQDEGVDWFTGRVKMTATGLVALTLSGQYVSLQKVGYVYSWAINMERGFAATTEIGQTWRRLAALQAQASITLNRYRFDTIFDQLANTDWVLLKLYENDSSGFWAKVLKESMGYSKSVGDAADDEPLTFQTSSVVARIA